MCLPPQVWFRNLDSLIKHVNEYSSDGKIASDPHNTFSGLELFYSNPDIYTKAKHDDELTWEVKTDDFFPYSDCDDCFWTGYFTSRAELKKWERTGSSFLQAARQLEAFDASSAPPKTTFDSPTHKLDAAVGVVQHHDGVSGTAKQHVADDYAWRIDVGFKEAATYMAGVLKSALLKPSSDLEFSVCQGLNVSVCDVSQEATAAGEDLVIVAYNALSHSRTEVVRIPVATDDVDYTVIMYPENVIVASSTSPTTDTLVDAAAPFSLNIEAQNIPAMGARTFKVTQKPKAVVEETAETATMRRNLRSSPSSPITIANDLVSVSFDSKGNMQTINDQKITQDWGYYTSFDNSRAELGATAQPQGDFAFTPGVPGTCLPGYFEMEGDESRWLKDSNGQNSGAYIFRPSKKDEALTLLANKNDKKPTSVKVVESGLVTEVHAEFGDFVKQVTRIVENQPYVEIEWTVGPVPTEEDGIGKEVVMRLNSDIKSGDTFFTDSNGREFLERKIDYRPTWDLEVFQPIAGNYYPVNAAIFIEDDDSSLALLNDRTQGGASLQEGSLEIMVQRRTVADDSRGVGEPLDETTGGVTPYPPYGDAERVGEGVIIKGTHRIAVGKGNQGASTARKLMDETFSPLNLFFTSVKKGEDYEEKHSEKFAFEGVGADALPPQISMITLSKVIGEPGAYFVRLAHQFGAGEDEELSQSAKVDMNNILPFGMKMKAFKEMTLTGNQERKSMEDKRLKWVGEGEMGVEMRQEGRSLDNGDVVVIKSMEIRSFKIITEDENLGWHATL